MRLFVIILATVWMSLCSTQAYSQFDCEEGFISDCNGYCVPFEWLSDAICDDGVREWPPGSGYYADLSCESFMCDLFACEGCSDECDAGFVPDCNGNCVPPTFFFDGICDAGQRTYNGLPVDLSCQLFGCEIGACEGPCWEDNPTSPEDVGACCMGTTCEEMTRYACWSSGFVFIGNHTQCLENTCNCGEGLMSDCDGNCVPYNVIGGGYCAHGSIADYGDGEFTLNLDCEALACSLGTCTGSCRGACCAGGECFEAETSMDCLDVGGIFLGSFTPCGIGDTACTDQQKPIQLPDAELFWNGTGGEVRLFPRSMDSDSDILVVTAAVESESSFLKSAVCVFRYDYKTSDWVEEVLLECPEGSYPQDQERNTISTDGTRIATKSSIGIKGGKSQAIDIFHYNGSDWLHEQTITGPSTHDETSWGCSFEIHGEVLAIGQPDLNHSDETNGGGVHIYHFDSGEWTFVETLLPWGDPPYPDGQDPFLGLSVSLTDTYLASASQSSVLLWDISSGEAVEDGHLSEMEANFFVSHRGIDLDGERLLTHVTFSNVHEEQMAAKLFERIDGEWLMTDTLIPFDHRSPDRSGYVVKLDGDLALITSPWDNDLGPKTGSAYVFEYKDDGDGMSWQLNAKLWSERAVAEDQFGLFGTLHNGSAYLSGGSDLDTEGIKVFWPRGIAWTNPLGGNLNDATNWDPQLPASGDSVMVSLRAEMVIDVDGEIPFDHLFVGPGSPIFDLGGVGRSMGSSGEEAINLQGVSGLEAVMYIENGVLTVNGQVHVGESDLPAVLSLGSDSSGGVGGLHVNGYWLQHEAGTLDLELATGRPAPLQLYGVSPYIDGVVSLNLAVDYTPASGDEIPLVTTEFVDDDSGIWSIMMVNDPLPEGLYVRYVFTSPHEGTTYYQATAIVDELDNLFGYGDPNSTTVNGLAVDVAVADLLGGTRGGDGYDDIVVITVDNILVFVSDGQGGIASQYTIPMLGSDLTAVDVGDVDGDSDIDIVVCDKTANTFTTVYNDDSVPEQFTVGSSVATAIRPVDVLLKNIDGDNDKDVILACFGTTITDGSLEFYESVSAGLGPYNHAGSTTTGGGPSGIDPGDVNNDKDLSINVLLKSNNTVGKARNTTPLNGSFNWVLDSETTVAIGPSKLSTGDFNGDSLPDVVVSSPESDAICVLRGTADGGLAGALQLNVGNEPESITVVDFDNDGDDDIAVIAEDHDTTLRAIFLYRNDTNLNNGNMIFAFDSKLDEGANPILVSKGNLDSVAGVDLVSVTASQSLTGGGNEVRIRQTDNTSSCLGDLDENGTVSVDDLLLLIGAWGQTGGVPADLDGSGVVGIDDLLLLIGAWGPCS